MAFIESPSFPTELAFGARGGPQYSTSVVQTRSGRTYRNEEWSAPLYQYEIGLVNRSATLTRSLFAFFHAVARGQLHGFRFRDPNPGESTCTDEPIGTGNGSATAFQLVKRYTSGALSYVRTISKPVPGTVTCKINNVTTAAFTVNTATGVVTFTSPPGNGLAVTASCTFDVPVQFLSDQMGFESTESEDAYTWPSIRLSETRDIA